MNLQVFRLPNDAAARATVHGLQRSGLATRAGVRRRQAYVTVRSDRTDVLALVSALVPTAVRVAVEHLPAPLPGEVPLFS